MSESPHPLGDRLQKVLAHAGIASRRAAEDLIAAGRVTVNGEIVSEMGRRVLATDGVSVDGVPVQGAERLIYLMLNKPTGFITTTHDPEGRPTVLALVRSNQRIYPIGRLDWDTEGLLLLTNDGELANRLTHPRFGVEKEYHALVSGYPNQIALNRLTEGMMLEDGKTEPSVVKRLRQDKDGIWIGITIHEGRNRQVRRMLDEVGHPAKALVRVRVGSLVLDDLPSGAYRPLTSAEVATLRAATHKSGGRDRPEMAQSQPVAPTVPRTGLPRRQPRRRMTLSELVDRR